MNETSEYPAPGLGFFPQVDKSVLRVLVVEDNALDYRLLEETLCDEGSSQFVLKRAENLSEALNVVAEESFDAILLDLYLPDSRGLETLERLKTQAETLPIIVLTGIDDAELSLRMLQKGAQDYLVKEGLSGADLARALRYATERKRVEVALSASRAQIEDIMASLKHSVWVTQPGGEPIYLSPSMEEVYGYPVQAFFDDPELWLKLVFDEDKALFEDYWESLQVKGQTNVEYRIVRADGELRWIYDRGLCIRDDAGQVVRCEGLVSDITERKIAEAALQKSESRQRALLSTLPDLLLLYSPEGVYLDYFADKEEDLYTEPKNFIGKHLSKVLPEEITKLVEHHLALALQRGKAQFEYELDMNGPRIFEARLARTDDGNVLSLVRDISEWRRSEKRLKESEKRYRQLFSEASRQTRELELLHQMRTVIMQQFDLHTLFQTTVDTVAKLFGYDKIAMVKKEAQGLVLASQHGYAGELEGSLLEREGLQRALSAAETVLSAQDGRSSLYLPLLVKAQVAGALVIETDRAAGFSEHDLAIMSALSEQISIAAENADLHEQTRTDLKRNEALYQVSQAATHADSLQTLLEIASRHVLEALDATWVVGYTVDIAARCVLDVASESAAETPLEPFAFEDLWDSLSGYALRERKVIISPKTQADPRENEAVQRQRREQGIGSVVVAPLILDNQTLGTITALRRLEDKDFDEQDINLTVTIAAQVAMAIGQRRLLDQLEHQAYHDALTGLPNRLLFEDRLSQGIALARRHKQVMALLFVDLDGFKNVNDSLGHQAGDELLVQVAARLEGRVRESDTLARMGGDEFAILLSSLRCPPDSVRVAQNYLELFKEPFRVCGQEIFMTASIGVCLFPDDGEDAQTLLKHSDSAMYRAKGLGKNSVESFTPELAQGISRRLSLENELRRAIEKEELVLFYQPQIDLRRGHTLGLEALLRWQHTSRGTISPGEFIPIAEETGLIVPIGNWVLREACTQNKAWQREGRSFVKVSVNVSAVQFVRSDFVATVADALKESGLEAKWLELELTESVVMNDMTMVETKLAELRKLGVRVAIDDFGTGYSSLRYLQTLTIDSLKIDRSFVNAIEATETGEFSALVQTIVTLAKNLRLNTVAEGIETDTQLSYLKRIGCDEAQGYYFSKPLPAQDVWQTLAAMSTTKEAETIKV